MFTARGGGWWPMCYFGRTGAARAEPGTARSRVSGGVWHTARRALSAGFHLFDPGFARSLNVMGVAKAALEASVRYLAHDLGPDQIRVNAISAGPIRTLSASAIAGFRTKQKQLATIVPLRRNVTIADVGNTAVWLCSDLAANVTGETIYVDGGLHHITTTTAT